MAYEKVKSYFESIGLGERVVVREHIGDTVENAAEAIGCEPKQIAKTMSFLIDCEPILIVMAGDARVDNKKYKACFRQKATMLPYNQVEEKIGHIPGAVCPFVICKEIPVYLDISLKRFDTVYTSGGSLNSTVQLSLAELEKYSHAMGWIDSCNGWEVR